MFQRERGWDEWLERTGNGRHVTGVELSEVYAPWLLRMFQKAVQSPTVAMNWGPCYPKVGTIIPGGRPRVTRTQGTAGSLRLWEPRVHLCSQGLGLWGSGFERVSQKPLTAKAPGYAIKGTSLCLFCNFHLSRKNPQLYVTKVLELLKLKPFFYWFYH